MPQHKSAEKRVRQNIKRRERNRMHRSRMRTMIRNLKDMTDPSEASTQLNEVKAYIDRMTSKGIMHRNKAAHQKSKLEHHVNNLG